MRRRFETMADVPAEIREAYDRGAYFCEVPYVHDRWTDLDWINHILATGGFTK